MNRPAASRRWLRPSRDIRCCSGRVPMTDDGTEGEGVPPEETPLTRLVPDAQGKMIELIAENARLKGALAAEQAKVADYENGISWNTSCTGCVKLLDQL